MLALGLLAGTFFLISPAPGKTYPGAIPWAEFSVLHRLTDWMSLGGRLVGVRGVEIKELVFHLAAALGLVLLGLRVLVVPGTFTIRRLGAVGSAQFLLAGWVGLSLLSGLWAQDAEIARGQGLLYAMGLAWAVALGQTFSSRDLPALRWGILIICTVGAALCLWYYHERNPYHNPGFPMGNPTTLAPAILPGVLMAVAELGRSVARWCGGRETGAIWAGLVALAALVPLVWCLELTHARGAHLALLVGLATIAVCLVGRRTRWVLAGLVAVGLIMGGAWWFSSSRLDVTMARGATIRFRLYAWRYASELWSASSLTRVAGQGAGAYPRLAGALAVRDRALDSAAFMGEIVEHAHNELFEILAEIGLLGGVTYVGGLLATLWGAAALLASPSRKCSGGPSSPARPHGGPKNAEVQGPAPPGRALRVVFQWVVGRSAASADRWLHVGLLASLVALVADSMFGVALRLPGVPAIFFTLLGAVWAVCRAPIEQASSGGSSYPTPVGRIRGGLPTGSITVAAICLSAAAATGWLGASNWRGIQLEYAASVAAEQGRYLDALADIQAARAVRLDPVRQIAGRKLALECRFGLARQAFAACLSQGAAASPTARQTAIRLAEEAHAAAGHLSLTVPSLTHTDVIAARTAEWLAALLGESQPQAAREWVEKAEKAWSRQRGRTPFDVETLLALSRYRRPLGDYVGLVRDAMRFLHTQSRDTRRLWQTSLSWLAQRPGFEATMQRLLAAAAPITPQTDPDAIVASMAPETERLAAAWRALGGQYAAAEEHAARAAALYQAVRARLPEHQSVALGEQAEYALREPGDGAVRAVALLHRAIAALPQVQAQKYSEAASPLRLQLCLACLAADQVDAALAALHLALGEQAEQPAVVEQTLHRLLHEAQEAGMTGELIGRIRGHLCPRFPNLCQPSTQPDDSSDAAAARASGRCAVPDIAAGPVRRETVTQLLR